MKTRVPHRKSKSCKPRRFLVAIVATSVLAACQSSNLAGQPGYQPTSCAMVGSSCESYR